MSAPRRSPRRSRRGWCDPGRTRGRPSATRPTASAGCAGRRDRARLRGRRPLLTRRSSGAELEALELEHLRTFLAERVADLLAGIVDPLLLEQDVGAEETLVQHALDDLFAGLLRLRLHLVGARVDLTFLRDGFLGNVVAPHPVRLHRGDVHGELARQIVGAAAQLQQHADLVPRWMRVRSDLRPVHGLEAGRTRDDDVLAELAGELRTLLLDLGLRAGPV